MSQRLKALIAQAEAELTSMDELRTKLDASDAAGKTQISETLKGKSATLDAIKDQIAQEKAAIVTRQELADLKGKTGATGGDLRAPATAIDHDQEDREKTGLVMDYIQGKTLSDQARVALAPKSKSLKDGADGVALPDSLKVAIFGKRWANAMGKSIPMVSTDAYRSALVPQDYRRELLEANPEMPFIIDMATVVPSTTGTVTWPRLVQTDANEYGSVTVGWTDEGGEKPAAEGKFEQFEIAAKEVSAYTEVSNRLLARSAIGLEPLLSRLFGGAIKGEMNRTFLRGTGVGQPLGVVNDPLVRLVSRNATGKISYTDLVNLEFALRAYHRAGASYVVTDMGIRDLKLSNDTTGRSLFVPSIAGGAPDRLNGYRYMATHQLATLGTHGDCVFGDWREYIVAMEEDVVIKRSEHYKFRNNVTAFAVYAVVGGAAALPRCFAVLGAGVSSTTGPATTTAG